MYRLVVLIAAAALVSASLSFPSNNVLDNNVIDSGPSEGKEWLLPLLLSKNSSISREQPNDVTNLFTHAQLTAVPSKGKVDDTIRYTLGKRVGNDRLVGHGSDSRKWATPQDVTVVLKYPSSGVGATVTYVEIVVSQSSNIGQANVISGGIGQRSVAIVLKAGNTYWLGYDAYVYGI